MLRWLLDRILYGGTSGFTEYETTVLQSVVDRMPLRDAASLRHQLESVSLVQRTCRGKMVIAFLQKDDTTALSDTMDEHCLARVRFKSGVQNNCCSIVTHKGFLSSIEFQNTPGQIQANGIEVLSIELRPKAYTSLADKIDKKKHT